jgi:hypothetical protein
LLASVFLFSLWVGGAKSAFPAVLVPTTIDSRRWGFMADP